MKNNEHVVAKAVRLEHEEERDVVYIVFKVTDEQFKRSVLEDWKKDVELRVVGRSLVKTEE